MRKYFSQKEYFTFRGFVFLLGPHRLLYWRRILRCAIRDCAIYLSKMYLSGVHFLIKIAFYLANTVTILSGNGNTIFTRKLHVQKEKERRSPRYETTTQQKPFLINPFDFIAQPLIRTCSPSCSMLGYSISSGRGSAPSSCPAHNKPIFWWPTPVLRIRNFYPGSWFFPSRISDPKTTQ